MTATAVSLQGFTKDYGSFRAVDNLSLEIPMGSIYGLLGSNGAGKTTTFRALCGYLRPTAGTISILGLPSTSPLLRHGRIAALPQDAVLPSHHTVGSFLAYMGELQRMSRKRAHEEALRVLSMVGLLDSYASPTRALSHGMARRVALAQSFLGSPDLILLDEPTSGLDPRQAHELRNIITAMRGKCTVLLASHNLAEVQEVCDRVAIIDKGKVASAGSVDEICRTTQTLLIELTGGEPDLVRLKESISLEVIWKAQARQLLVEIPQDGSANIDAITASTLQFLIDHKLGVQALRRGESLEKRFLELT